MAITTTPKFYYIDRVTSNDNLLNFDEGLIESTAEITPSAYSVTQLATAVQTALNLAGGQTYTVSFDRDTRFITISAASNFDLLVSSGSNAGLSIFTKIGFTGADRTGANSYTGDTAIASEYMPLFPLQNFRGFEDNEQALSASINESADANVVEVISFGRKRLMSFNVRYVTDQAAGFKDSIFGDNPNLVQETRDFLSFIIGKSRLEFMKDETDPNTFDVVLLESTSQSRTGTAYELRELYDVGLGYYETGTLTFRKIE